MTPAESPNGSGEESELSRTIRLLSHQLKGPVSAIRSLLDAITQGAAGEVSPQVARILVRASARADEARELVSDLLDYEAYGGKKELPLEELDLLELAARALARVEPAALDKEMTLRDELPRDAAAWVRGDRKALEQALGNILDNAVKYSPPRGEVTVAAEIQAETRQAILRVSDTGPGIPAEELGRLFEPFYRSPRLRAAAGGTGLGLALSRRIVEAHGGTIEASSREGGGSTFTLTLPLERVEHRPQGERASRRVVIVGGVTAGPKAAARLRRLDPEAEITMVEKGEFLSYSGCSLPRYVAGRMQSPRELLSTEEDAPRSSSYFRAIKDVRVLSRTLATAIDRERRLLRCKDLPSGREIDLPYDVLVLATGARPLVPGIPGIESEGVYAPYSMEQARELKSRLDSHGPADTFVVGGGFIGIAIAESLVHAGSRVTLVERRPQLMERLFDPPMARRIQEELERRGIRVLTSVEIAGIEKDGEQLRVFVGGRTLHADLLVVAAGVVPEVELAREAGIEIGSAGGIRVSERLQSSDPRIFAVGDCAETQGLASGRPESLPLGSVSTKMGRIVAEVIAGRDACYRGSVGTALLKVFDLEAARCGLTQATAIERGLDAVSGTVRGLDRQRAMPGAAEIRLSVVADRRSRILLGAQGVGAGDVVERIRVLATAVGRGLTLEEVFALDLGYNPAYGAPIDLAQAACLHLQNKLDGLLDTIAPEELEARRSAFRVVDVSPAASYSPQSCAGSVNVPLESLRKEGIPYGKDEEVVLCGGSSSRPYEASRILAGMGWEKLKILEDSPR